MTRKIVYRSVAALVLIIVFTANLSFAHSVRSLFHPKLARAAFDIECNCALFGGNTNCAVNNYGSTCAPAGTQLCSTYNGNCGG